MCTDTCTYSVRFTRSSHHHLFPDNIIHTQATSSPNSGVDMTSWDAIAVATNDAERNAFYSKFLGAEPEIAAFVDHRLGWGGAGKYKEWLKGSFNLSAVIEHCGNGNRALIRFPIPGRIYEP
ncbi:hypothetical protein QBC33DRAFT_529138 [Phialemonium atrogriseum]|uniref:Uncharacterized protein n=1 Tax=Phialemonium atrogriseum TaxID=1093897 RepID=A0AAJ0C4J3_9PEZI|nr:uncharacterized protein QBC33DRAFT_529138 [Phialemonium atrogriseum]KAK1769795.1 hypothetical protein QBC33DRAFT_529138 [Phialemonium atrogriseum]